MELGDHDDGNGTGNAETLRLTTGVLVDQPVSFPSVSQMPSMSWEFWYSASANWEGVLPRGQGGHGGHINIKHEDPAPGRCGVKEQTQCNLNIYIPTTTTITDMLPKILPPRSC